MGILTHRIFDHDDVDIQQHERKRAGSGPVSRAGECVQQSLLVLRHGHLASQRAVVARGNLAREHFWPEKPSETKGCAERYGRSTDLEVIP